MQATLQYNSAKGRATRRPRKSVRPLGQPSKELRSELSKMGLFERKQMYIRASICVIGITSQFMG